MFFKDIIKSPIGNLIIEYSEKGIIRISIKENIDNIFSDTMPISFLSDGVKDSVNRYFQFPHSDIHHLPLDLSAFSTFYVKVWKFCQKISIGRRVSYSYIGEKLGLRNYQRTIGFILSKNPIPLIIPCHRVIKKTGDLGGYIAGQNIKKWLLNWENQLVNSSKEFIV